MSHTIVTTLPVCQLPVDRVSELIHSKESFCEFSRFERFIDFFRYIFTGNSLCDNYQSVFNSIEIDDSGLLGARDSIAYQKWHPVLCMARLIDKTRDEYKNNHNIEHIKFDADCNFVAFNYGSENILLKKMFTDDEFKIIDQHLFSTNNRKLVGSVISFECQLYETLGDLLNRDMGINNAHSLVDLEDKIISRKDSISPEAAQIAPSGQEEGYGSSEVAEKKNKDNVQVLIDENAEHENKTFSPGNNLSPENTKVVQQLNDKVGGVSATADKTTGDAVANIDTFIRDNIEGKDLNTIVSQGKKLGAGAYGTAYRIGDFVVKSPMNKHNIEVSPINENAHAHPERAARYLNKANADDHFARAVSVPCKEGDKKLVDVLISKFITGYSVVDNNKIEKEPDENKKKALEDKQMNALDDALDILYDRGLEMYDHDIDGNVLKAENGQYYFVDADQIVLAANKRSNERRLSQATIDLEKVLHDQYVIESHKEKQQGEFDGFYTQALQILNENIAAAEQAKID